MIKIDLKRVKEDFLIHFAQNRKERNRCIVLFKVFGVLFIDRAYILHFPLIRINAFPNACFK